MASRKYDIHQNEVIDSHDLKVGTRIVLFGEHSDWISEIAINDSKRYDIDKYREVISSGLAISTTYPFCIKGKVYNRALSKPEIMLVRSHESDDDTIIEASVDHITESPITDLLKSLDAIIDNNEYPVNTYVLAAIRTMIKYYGGIDLDTGCIINIIEHSIPTSKGFASSAAIITFVIEGIAKANRIQLTPYQIANLAYIAEHDCANGKCGTLDQVVAFDPGLYRIDFRRDFINNKITPMYIPLDIGTEKKTRLQKIPILLFYFEDKKKNTTDIITSMDLYIKQSNSDEDRIKELFLLDGNKYYVDNAISAIQNGELARLGLLMNEWQNKYNNLMKDVGLGNCRDMIIESMMENKYIMDNIYGIKGLGSHGASTGIMLLKSPLDEEKSQLISEIYSAYPNITLKYFDTF